MSLSSKIGDAICLCSFLVAEHACCNNNPEGNGDTADKLWRSFGTLRYARKLDTAEAARLISNVRFGAVCGVIPEAESINLISLLFSVMPAHILQKYPDAKTPEKRDECRADYVRRVFAA